MTASISVGKSATRTPIKHWLLNKTLGKIVGTLSNRSRNVPAKLPLLIVDLCAGDGVDTEESGTCSPSIIRHHYRFRGIDSKVILYEKNSATFERLMENFGNVEGFDPRNKNAIEFRLLDEITRPDQAVFLHIDPNSVNDISMLYELAKSITPTTTWFVTLGCNPAGLKRLPKEERDAWFEWFNAIVSTTPEWHDIQLFALDKDDAQWAYMLRIPYKWADENFVGCMSAGAKMWKHGFNGASLRKNKDDVYALRDKLFFTKKELEAQDHD